ncbi:MAG: hypothetical protein WCL25_01065, partial [bacterium]
MRSSEFAQEEFHHSNILKPVAAFFLSVCAALAGGSISASVASAENLFPKTEAAREQLENDAAFLNRQITVYKKGGLNEQFREIAQGFDIRKAFPDILKSYGIFALFAGAIAIVGYASVLISALAIPAIFQTLLYLLILAAFFWVTVKFFLAAKYLIKEGNLNHRYSAGREVWSLNGDVLGALVKSFQEEKNDSQEGAFSMYGKYTLEWFKKHPLWTGIFVALGLTVGLLTPLGWFYGICLGALTPLLAMITVDFYASYIGEQLKFAEFYQNNIEEITNSSERVKLSGFKLWTTRFSLRFPIETGIFNFFRKRLVFVLIGQLIGAPLIAYLFPGAELTSILVGPLQLLTPLFDTLQIDSTLAALLKLIFTVTMLNIPTNSKIIAKNNPKMPVVTRWLLGTVTAFLGIFNYPLYLLTGKPIFAAFGNNAITSFVSMTLVSSEISSVLNYSQSLANLNVPLLDKIIFEPLNTVMQVFEKDILGMGSTFINGVFGQPVNYVYTHLGIDSSYVNTYWNRESAFREYTYLGYRAQQLGDQELISDINSIITGIRDGSVDPQLASYLAPYLRAYVAEASGDPVAVSEAASADPQANLPPEALDPLMPTASYTMPGATSFVYGSPYRCFLGDTQITLADGSTKAMRDIRPGDMILGNDGIAHRVLQLNEYQADSYYVINLANGLVLSVTSDHLVLARGAGESNWGWFPISSLDNTYSLYALDGSAVAITSIVPNASAAKVYNLVLEDSASYFAEGILAATEDARVYVVQPGDSWGGIASTYLGNYALGGTLRTINSQIVGTRSVQSGQRVIVPFSLAQAPRDTGDPRQETRYHYLTQDELAPLDLPIPESGTPAEFVVDVMAHRFVSEWRNNGMPGNADAILTQWRTNGTVTDPFLNQFSWSRTFVRQLEIETEGGVGVTFEEDIIQAFKNTNSRAIKVAMNSAVPYWTGAGADVNLDRFVANLENDLHFRGHNFLTAGLRDVILTYMEREEGYWAFSTVWGMAWVWHDQGELSVYEPAIVLAWVWRPYVTKLPLYTTDLDATNYITLNYNGRTVAHVSRIYLRDIDFTTPYRSVPSSVTLPAETQSAIELDFSGAVPLAYLSQYDRRGNEVARLTIALPSLRLSPTEPITLDEVRSRFIELYNSEEFVNVEFTLMERRTVRLPATSTSNITQANGVPLLEALGFVSVDSDYQRGYKTVNIEALRQSFTFNAFTQEWELSGTTNTTGINRDGDIFQVITDGQGETRWEVRNRDGRLIERYQRFAGELPQELVLFTPSRYDNTPRYVVDLTTSGGITLHTTGEESSLWNLSTSLDNITRVYYYDIPFQTPYDGLSSSVGRPSRLSQVVILDFTSEIPQAYLIDHDIRGYEVDKLTLSVPSLEVGRNEYYSSLRSRFVNLYNNAGFEYSYYTVIGTQDIRIPLLRASNISQASGIAELEILNFVDINSVYPARLASIRLETARENYRFNISNGQWELDSSATTEGVNRQGYVFQVVTTTDNRTFWNVRNSRGKLLESYQEFIDGKPRELFLYTPSEYDNMPRYMIDLSQASGVTIPLGLDDSTLWNLGTTLQHVSKVYYYDIAFSTPYANLSSQVGLSEKVNGVVILDFTSGVPQAYLVNYNLHGDEVERLNIALPDFDIASQRNYRELREEFIRLYNNAAFEYISYTVMQQMVVDLPQDSGWVALGSEYATQENRRIKIESMREIYVYDSATSTWILDSRIQATKVDNLGNIFQEARNGRGDFIAWDVRDILGRLVERDQYFVEGNPTEHVVYVPSTYDNQPLYVVDLTGEEEGVTLVIDGTTVNNVIRVYFYNLPQFNEVGVVSAGIDFTKMTEEGSVELTITTWGQQGSVLEKYIFDMPLSEFFTTEPFNYIAMEQGLTRLIQDHRQATITGATLTVGTLQEERHRSGFIDIDNIPGLLPVELEALRAAYPGIEQVVGYDVINYRNSSRSSEYYYGRFDYPVLFIIDNPEHIDNPTDPTHPYEVISQEDIVVVNRMTGQGATQRAEEVLIYLKDSGILVIRDVFVRNVDLSEVSGLLGGWGVQLDDRPDDFNDRLADLLGVIDRNYLQLYDRTIYTYNGGEIYSEDPVHLFFEENSHEQPVIAKGAYYTELIYPEGKVPSAEYSNAIDPRYFPIDRPAYTEAPQVIVVGNTIQINGHPYEIRGTTLSTTPEGENLTALVLDASSLSEAELDLMVAKGINTVRTYYPPTLDLLDALAAHNIRVIVGFPYEDNRENRGPDIASGTYRAYIEAYKDHPAILMWEFGNEPNYTPLNYGGGDVTTWYSILEATAQETRRIDPHHPVSSTFGYTSGTDVCGFSSCQEGLIGFRQAVSLAPSVQVWGLNIYNWDNLSAAVAEARTATNKPIYISETGADSYDTNAGAEDRQAQADAAVAIWRSLDGSGVVGVTYMTWRDEWWKAGNPTEHNQGGAWFAISNDGFGNEEYFGWVDIHGQPKPVLAAMGAIWHDGDTIPVLQTAIADSRAPPIPEEYFTPLIEEIESTNRLIYQFANEPYIPPEFLPALSVITTFRGTTAEFSLLGDNNDDSYVDIPIYYTHDGSTETIRLPELYVFTTFTTYGQTAGYILREPMDSFGRIIISANTDRTELYLIRDFQSTNVYQPAVALKLVWDANLNDGAGAYRAIEIYNSQADLVDFNDIYTFNDQQRADIIQTIADIRQVSPAEVLSTPAYQMLVETDVVMDGVTFTQYSVPGDQVGRVVIIDRGNSIFIAQSFIGLTQTPLEGYFIDKPTGGVTLEILNTDAGDPAYGLGPDFDLKYYRVRYYNPTTGEVWYRWHYPEHIWGGWAYEERGHFEQVGTSDTGAVENRWIPESRLCVDEWSMTLDEPLRTRFYYIINNHPVLAYTTAVTDHQTARDIITPAIARAYRQQYGRDIWEDMLALGIDPDTTLLSRVERTPVLWEGSSTTGVTASGVTGPTTIFWTLPSDPLGREFVIQAPTGEDTFKYTVNLWWVDNDAPLTVLPASLTLDSGEIELRTFTGSVSTLPWYNTTSDQVEQRNVSELNLRGFGSAYVYDVHTTDNSQTLIQA